MVFCDSGLVTFEFVYNNAQYSDGIITLHISGEPKSENVDSPRKRRRVEYGGRDVVNKTICISSLILASKSQFFYKLFSLESNKRYVTLQILESEKAAFMDLLRFMNSNTLPRITPAALLEVLGAAHKYEVPTCIKFCFQLLLELPMTSELALRCLDIPSTILMDDNARLLTDSAKECLVAHYKEIYKFEEEILNFPLVGIEAVLASDGLEVASEDCIYNFVMKWVRKHYTTLDERQEILAKRLLHLIRFPFMSCSKLEEVLNCSEINLEVSSQLVFQALASKIPHRQSQFVPRVYQIQQVKIMRYNLPYKTCTVWLDVKRETLMRLSPSDSVSSQHFEVSGHELFLLMEHHVDKESSLHSFGLHVCKEEEDVSIRIEYALSWRNKPEDEFFTEREFKNDFVGNDKHGSDNLFNIPWTMFINDTNLFRDEILHLKVIIWRVLMIFN